MNGHPSSILSIPGRIATLDWTRIEAELDTSGCALIHHLLSRDECRMVAAMYGDDASTFRSRVVMGRHGFGRGEYKYFAYPLPGLVQTLRSELYQRSGHRHTLGVIFHDAA